MSYVTLKAKDPRKHELTHAVEQWWIPNVPNFIYPTLLNRPYLGLIARASSIPIWKIRFSSRCMASHSYSTHTDIDRTYTRTTSTLSQKCWTKHCSCFSFWPDESRPYSVLARQWYHSRYQFCLQCQCIHSLVVVLLGRYTVAELRSWVLLYRGKLLELAQPSWRKLEWGREL